VPSSRVVELPCVHVREKGRGQVEFLGGVVVVVVEIGSRLAGYR
jgi:hypothetical protein